MMMILKDKGGFTFVELFVALLIFALGIVGVAKLQMAAVASNSFSLQLTQALNIAENQIETLKNQSLTAAAFALGAHTSGAAVTTDEGRSFNLSWVVAPITSSQARTVTVTVAWTEKAANHATSLTFIKGNNQP